MKPRSLVLSCSLSLCLAGCDAGAPLANDGREDRPAVELKIAQRSQPVAERSAGEDESAGECEEWITESESYDEATGAFEYVYSCPKGGDIERAVTAGVVDEAGNGGYTTTYTLRDGSSESWTMAFETGADGAQSMSGVSSRGETLEARYEPAPDGATKAMEVWRLEEGLFVVDGVYEADGRFNGSMTFDDPATVESPDSRVEQVQGADGRLLQQIAMAEGGWSLFYDVAVEPDGSVAYRVAHDELASAVVPDISGSFEFDVAGAGSGEWSQGFDDGSLLEVEDVFEASGAARESWRFRDADRAVEIDQEGFIDYAPDGTGQGSVTDHLADGSSVTCKVSVAADGASSVTECR